MAISVRRAERAFKLRAIAALEFLTADRHHGEHLTLVGRNEDDAALKRVANIEITPTSANASPWN